MIHNIAFLYSVHNFYTVYQKGDVIVWLICIFIKFAEETINNWIISNLYSRHQLLIITSTITRYNIQFVTNEISKSERNKFLIYIYIYI